MRSLVQISVSQYVAGRFGARPRLKRQLTEADRNFIDLHASHYVQYAERYREEMGNISVDDDDVPF